MWHIAILQEKPGKYIKTDESVRVYAFYAFFVRGVGNVRLAVFNLTNVGHTHSYYINPQKTPKNSS